MPPSLNADKTLEKFKKLVANNLIYVEDLFAGDHNNNTLKNTAAKHSSVQVRQPQQPQKEQYIRIFKDSTPEELWRSYCRGMGLNADDPDLVSFRITVHSSEDIHPERGEDLQ